MTITEAQAEIRGTPSCPCLCGLVRLTQKGCGTVVQVQVSGLPRDCGCVPRFYGFHIEGCGCRRSQCNCAARGRYELTPLLNSNGEACMTFYTGEFAPCDVIGRQIVITLEPDGVCRYPSDGCAIGCGEICPISRCCPSDCRDRYCPPKPIYPPPPRPPRRNCCL